ncbi:ABC transporter permease [Pseudovibrio sp. SPO723]|uniref:ABC transporter permease n=1 Tax=Nesiotobacter zosterae TaxID=392721 RepID=UPI0029C383B8|nr:ABC transporter permease [Pseudovibrio sp. SPO723]MDX5593621.1 ABC transporter permease [Pseudovibrio sp. SPO723]
MTNSVTNTALPDTAEPTIQKPEPPKKGWTFGRVVGNFLVTLWIIAGLGILYFLVVRNNVTINFNVAEGFPWVDLSADPKFLQRYGMKLLEGFWVTLQVVGVSVLLGALLSVPIAAMRMSNVKAFSVIAYAYVYFFRGTPMLAQVFLIYYGAGSFMHELRDMGLWSFFRDAWNCAIFAFTLNTAAYQAEILRGSIQNMPKGQWEAASALGLPRWLTFWKIILPQALIVSLRPYGNEIILMIKGSAIVSIITILDLMGETRRAFSRTYDFQAYVWAAIMYLVMVETLRRIWNQLEARLTRHLQR